ncbi:ADP-ribosylation [Phellopilus nigrolimitatus]|nr:ADP-ribosylation [Phellopilus nigrolimitatus]
MYTCTNAMSDSFCSRQAGEQIRLELLEPDTVEYLQVKILLKSGWNHKKKRKPRLIRVFKIMRPSRSYATYFTYQQKIHIQSLLLTNGSQSNADESLLFHGTSRACLLGEEDNQDTICSSSRCSLCKIIQSSFDVKRCGSNHKFSRFGRAIYTTACSSKADDYCKPTHPDAKKRFLLLNRVLVGREFRTKENSTHLLQAPSGYHSVTGEPGGHLNYEETVVYNNDAIRPAYLVIYEPKPDSSVKTFLRNVFHMPLA